MKKIPLILLLLLGFQIVSSQEVAIENTRGGYTLPSIDNILNIVVEGESCEDVFVKTNNGTIEKIDSGSCKFKFRPKRIGYSFLSVYKTSGSDTTLIKERKFRVKRWPDCRPHFGRITSMGKMGREQFLAYDKIYVPTLNLNIDTIFPVSSYEIIVIRSGEVAYDLKNTGGKIEQKNRDILADLCKGDVVLFQNIMARFLGEPADRNVGGIRIEIVK